MTLSMRLWRVVKYTITRFGWFALGFLANLGMAVYASKGNGRAKLGKSYVEGDEPASVVRLPVRTRPANFGVFPDKMLYTGAGELDE